MELKKYIDRRIKEKSEFMELFISTRIEEIVDREGCSYIRARERLADLTDEEITYGYGTFVGAGEVPDAYSIGKIEGLYALVSDEHAASFYEYHDGNIIRDINTDKYYIDDPENRKKVEQYYHDKAEQYLTSFFSDNKYVARRIDSVGMVIRLAMKLRDGFSFSVQAGKGYSSLPAKELYDGQYESFEVGYPNAEESLLEGEAGYSLYGTDEVCEYVNKETIIQIIMKHGIPKEE